RQRGAADCGRAAAVGAPAHRRILRVAVDHLDVVDADAQFVCDDLRERRLFALTVRRRADEHVHLAAWMEADDRAFPEPALEPNPTRHLRRTEATDLDVERDTDADVAPLLARRLLLGPKLLIIHAFECLREHALVVAAVVCETRDDRVTV